MKVYIRDFTTSSVVREIEVHHRWGSPSYEKFEMGLLRNMDLEKFYLDDDECRKDSEVSK